MSYLLYLFGLLFLGHKVRVVIDFGDEGRVVQVKLKKIREDSLYVVTSLSKSGSLDSNPTYNEELF